MSRANPPDPDLVAERIGRLTTDALVTRRGYLKILGVLSGGLAVGNVAVALGAFRRRAQDATEEVVVVEDAESVPVGGSVRFLYPGRLDPAILLRLEEDTYIAYSVVCTHPGVRGAAPAGRGGPVLPLPQRLLQPGDR